MAWWGWRSTRWGPARPANAQLSDVVDARRKPSPSRVADDPPGDLVRGVYEALDYRREQPVGCGPGEGELRGQMRAEFRLVHEIDLMTWDQSGSS